MIVNKNLTYVSGAPRPSSGHTMATQKPLKSKAFWLLFFKKVTTSFLPHALA
jgi:hypothetical protein